MPTNSLSMISISLSCSSEKLFIHMKTCMIENTQSNIVAREKKL